MRPIIASCFVAYVTTNPNEGSLGKETQDASRLKRKASPEGGMTLLLSSLLYNPPQV